MIGKKSQQKVTEIVNENAKKNPAKVIENLHMTMTK